MNRLFMAAAICCLFKASGFCADTISGNSDYLITTWEREDGLPQSTVTCIVQTHDGYLWLGTFNGLARFDGARFTVFNRANVPELPDNRIRRLFEDRQGTLWISCEGGGLATLSAGRFKRSLPDGQRQLRIDALLSAEEGTVLARTAGGEVILVAKGSKGGSFADLQGVKGEVVAQDGRGGLWVATVTNQLARFEDGSLVTSPDHWGLRTGRYQKTSVDKSQRLWVATEREVALWHNGRFVPKLQSEADEPFRIEHLSGNKDGSFWVALNGRYQRFKDGERVADAGVWPLAPLSSASGAPSVEDSEGNQWWGFFGAGLVRIKPDGSRLQFGREDGLPCDRVRALYEDREGSLWAGLDGGGLARLRPSRLHVYSERDGLSQNTVLSVCEDSEGTVWVGSNGGGLNRLRAGAVTHFDLGRDGTQGYVWSVFPDRQGDLWAGTYDNGLWRWQKGQFVPAFDSALIQDQVLSIYEDRQGRLWLGNSAGVSSWQDGRLTSYTPKDGLSQGDIRAIEQDGAGDLWFGSNGGGLTRLSEGRFTSFRAKDGLAHDMVWALHADRTGTLWVGTVGGGLSRLKNGRFTTIRKRHGLPDDIICHITEDAQGEFWMSSYAGLWRVTRAALEAVADKKTNRLSCLTFTRMDGLPSLECAGGFQPSGWRGRDGRLWFPTAKGVAVVDPSGLRVNSVPPPVILQSMWVDGELVMTSEPNADYPSSYRLGKVAGSANAGVVPAAPLRIEPGRQDFAFSYTALSLIDASKVRFKYRLEGLDRSWVEAGTQRTAQYTYVPPGSYTFRVIACNDNGVWDQEGAALAFTVLAPFYLTWWFVTIAACSSIGLVAGTARIVSVRRYQGKLERLRQQHALERERARIAQDMHDDLGASLTQIKLLGELADGENNLPGVLSRTRKMVDTAREMVQALDEIVWAVRPQNDRLESLVDYLGGAADEFFENTRVRCWHQTPRPVPLCEVSSEVRHNLFLAFRESLNNVVKHSDATEVRIDMAFEASSFRITIADNGKGFDPATVRPGRNGLSNIRDRLTEIHGDCEIFSQPGTGTKVRMTIPLHQSGETAGGRLQDRSASPHREGT